MAGRRGRTGRGWDAAPPRPRGTAEGTAGRPRADTPADPAERAREICLRLLAVRPRTRAELAGALRQRGVDEEVATEVLARYGEVGIIDDHAFARAWVTSRHHGRGLAKRALGAELRRKGVDSETVARALGELDPETEVATARGLVERKLRTERAATTEALLRRLVGMLARKGYAPGLAVRVVREALAERDAESERDAEGDETLDFDLIADSLESEAAASD